MVLGRAVMARKGAQRLPVSTRFLCRRRKLDEHNFERHSLASQLIYPLNLWLWRLRFVD